MARPSSGLRDILTLILIECRAGPLGNGAKARVDGLPSGALKGGNQNAAKPCQNGAAGRRNELGADTWNPCRSREQTLDDPGVRSGSGVSVLRTHDGPD